MGIFFHWCSQLCIGMCHVFNCNYLSVNHSYFVGPIRHLISFWFHDLGQYFFSKKWREITHFHYGVTTITDKNKVVGICRKKKWTLKITLFCNCYMFY